MMLIHRFPLTAQYGAIDVVGKVKGVVSGSPVFTGEGVKLNGDIANRINFTSQALSVYSMSCWVRCVDNVTSYRSIMMSANASSNYGTGWMFDGSGNLFFSCSWNPAVANLNTVAPTILNNKTHLITATIDAGKTLKHYLDGTLTHTVAGMSTLPTEFGFAFGCMGAYVGQQIGWNGFIGDARIYNHALSQTDVQRLFRDGMNGNRPVDRKSLLTLPSVSRL
jgi:hypothetical protein